MWSAHTIVYLVLCFLLLVYVMFMVFHHGFDSRIKEKATKLAEKLKDGPLQSLLNGFGINNIPKLNIISNNQGVVTANRCAVAPVRVGDNITDFTDADCVRTCSNSSAHLLTIATGENAIYQSSLLDKGAYCMIGPRPECNMRTTTALITVNSVTCVPRYPKLFGGEYGNKVIACNNRVIHDTRNALWDRKTNDRVDPYTVELTSEEELMPEGQPRFYCRYNGMDEHNNKYVENPINRFQPIKNYCTEMLYGAHPDIKMLIADDGNSFRCDCGDFNVTRVKNMYPDEPSSQCSPHQFSDVEVLKSKRKMTVPYRCFTVNSPITEVARYPPCPPDRFTEHGSQLSELSIEYSTSEHGLIEHPLYSDFVDDQNSGVYSAKYMTIW